MVLREKALKGDARALDRLLDLASRFNNEPAETELQALSTDDQAILAAYMAEIASASQHPTAASPLPSRSRSPRLKISNRRKNGPQMKCSRQSTSVLPPCCAATCATSSGSASRPILPGTPYLPNWHIDAIVYQLMLVQAGSNGPAAHQPAAALAEIDLRIGGLCRMAARS